MYSGVRANRKKTKIKLGHSCIKSRSRVVARFHLRSKGVIIKMKKYPSNIKNKVMSAAIALRFFHCLPGPRSNS